MCAGPGRNMFRPAGPIMIGPGPKRGRLELAGDPLLALRFPAPVSPSPYSPTPSANTELGSLPANETLLALGSHILTITQ